MQSLHHQELRRQELISNFGSNLRNRKNPSFSPQVHEAQPRNQLTSSHSQIVKKVRTRRISQLYRPIASTCLARKTVARGRKKQNDEEYDSVEEVKEEMGLPMKARSRMLNKKWSPRNVYERNPLLRSFHDHPTIEGMVGMSDEEVEDEESDETCSSRSIIPKTTSGQRMKFGLALLMIPSLIVIMNGHKKFNSSNSNVDYSGMGGAEFGGMPGLGGMGGHGSLGRGAGGIPGIGMPDDPLDALAYPGLKKGKKGRGKKGKKGKKNPFDPFEDTLEGKMKEMMGGIPGIDAQEQLEKIQQLQEQYKTARGGMMGKNYFDEDDEAKDEEDNDDGVAVDDEEAEVDLDGNHAGRGPEYLSGIGIENMEYPESFLDIGRRSSGRMSGGNPDPNLKSEVVTEIPIPGEESLMSELSAADVPTLKAIGYKVILIWSTDVELHEIPLGINSFLDHECEITKCVVTRNRSQEYLSDSIVVTPAEGDLPQDRRSDQSWILFHSHPSSSFSHEIPKLVVNLTWSFLSDSNITSSTTKREELSKDSFASLPPEQLVVFKKKKLLDVWNRKKRETKSVLFWSDSCEDANHSLSHLLAENSVGVEIIPSCPGSNICSQIADDESEIGFSLGMNEFDCYKKLLEDFYLFSLIPEPATVKCSNYVHEKLLKALETATIPIASVNSYRTVPMNSVVNSSSHELVIETVKRITKDFAQFMKYLEWKKKSRITSTRNDLCQLCSSLHSEARNEGFKVNDWFIQSNNQNCED